MGPWSKLPVDLLYTIEDNVVLYIDKVRIRAVCVSWSSHLPKLPNHQDKRFLWLLHPLHNGVEASHGLFNPIDKKVYEIYLPEARGKMFKGSCYGWIATVEDIHSTNPTDIYLINPITRAQIKLPQRTEFDDVVRYQPDQIDEEFIVRSYYDVPNDYHFVEGFFDEMEVSLYDMSLDMMKKVVLSSAPCEECVVVTIYGQLRQLAWCRCNDKRWTHIYAGIFGFVDIIFLNRKLYGLTDRGQVVVFENIGTNANMKVSELVATSVPIPRGRSAYLAECSDGSLIVVGRQFYDDRTLDKELIRTIGFKVFKLDSGNLRWVEVNNVGNDILFVGFSSAVISSDHLAGYKRNHIYFSDCSTLLDSVDENENSDSDMGVFNLEDGTLESLPGLYQPIWPRPIWINVG